MQMQFAGRCLDLGRPRVMGILNVTPDSFSDGGRFREREAAVRRAEAMVSAGADFIDIGGESTRPGAAPVSVAEELERVCPVVEAVTRQFDVVVSVDTSSPEVMRESAVLGAGLINDVRALQRPGALQAAVQTGVPVCLMHMQGEPGTMQRHPHYDDVVSEVEAFLLQRARACRAAGIPDQKILLDPGFGFGKTLTHNLLLLRGLPRLSQTGFPLLVGMSRKGMVGQITGKDLDQRLAGSLALAVSAVLKGAAIVRVHDVPETVDALKVVAAIQDENL